MAWAVTSVPVEALKASQWFTNSFSMGCAFGSWNRRVACWRMPLASARPPLSAAWTKALSGTLRQRKLASLPATSPGLSFESVPLGVPNSTT